MQLLVGVHMDLGVAEGGHHAEDTLDLLLLLWAACAQPASLDHCPNPPPQPQVLAGHSIDAGEAAACRLRALSFLEAAAAAMSCLLQHLRG